MIENNIFDALEYCASMHVKNGVKVKMLKLFNRLFNILLTTVVTVSIAAILSDCLFDTSHFRGLVIGTIKTVDACVNVVRRVL